MKAHGKKLFLKKHLKYISKKEILGKCAAADSILTFLRNLATFSGIYKIPEQAFSK